MTLLFTDVDRSTELVKRLGEGYAAVLAEHRDLLRAAFALGKQPTRRTGEPVRTYELVAPPIA